VTVGRILDKKGHQVFSVDEKASLSAAVAELAMQHVGVLVVVNAAREPVGIISERDIVKAIFRGVDLKTETVADAMTRLIVSCALDDTEGEVMERMGKANVRHLPVRHYGKMVGVVSARDLLQLRIEKLEALMKEVRSQAGLPD